MKKVLAIVALVAAMFIAGQAQAQISINAGYAPETFVTGNNSANYQGFFVGVTDNFTLAKGIGVAPGLQFRMNTRNYDGVLGKYKDTQMLLHGPPPTSILFLPPRRNRQKRASPSLPSRTVTSSTSWPRAASSSGG